MGIKMLPLLAALALAAALGPAGAADVGVTLQFSQPGVYGRVDLGNLPAPQLLASQPLLIAPPPVGMAPPAPVYMWVPPEHRAHWERHCREYHACGHPVYFVDQDWYREHVMARGHERDEHRERHREHEEDERHDHGHGEGRGG
jgi:hypothetical protein